MKYTLDGRKPFLGGSMWRRSMLIIGLLTVGLIIYDIHEMGVILYALSGI